MDATVTTYVTQYSNGEADLTAAQEFFDDIVGNYLARIPVLTNFATNLTVTSGNQVALPATSVQQMMVFYDGEQIGPLSTREANFLFPDWRDTTGRPRNWVGGTSNRASITLCPKPSAPTALISAIYTETRQTLPTYLQLPVAMLILYYEYSRESSHRNEALAGAYKAMGEFLMNIVLDGVSPLAG